jgi:hypothetical protein
MDSASQQAARAGLRNTLKVMTSVSSISVPEGLTIAEMQERDLARAAAAADMTSPPSSPAAPIELDPEDTNAVKASALAKWGSEPLLATTTNENEAEEDGEGEEEKFTGTGKGIDTKSPTGSKVRWKMPDSRVLKLRKEAKESGTEYKKVKKGYKEGLYAWKM